nr:MAG TPA: hypothetical protein [Bacteriophage sp.]
MDSHLLTELILLQFFFLLYPSIYLYKTYQFEL